VNILLVADLYPDPDSGAAGTEYQTLLALRSLGHNVRPIWRDELCHRISHGNLHYLLELPAAFRDAISVHCRKESYDVIHVNQPYAWLAAKEHRRSGRPGVFINRSHGWEPRIKEALRPWRKRYHAPKWIWPRGILGRPVQWGLRCYPRWCAQASDGIIVSCTEDQNYIINTHGKPAERVACIPQAPAPLFGRTEPKPMTPNRRQRVLYAGQAVFFKAPNVLADVFSRLAEQCPALQFTWCCPDSSHDLCRQMLRERARQRTRFVGWLPQEELIDLYDEHGIFIFPSLAEGFGKVFLEAMARGLCVVASRTAGMRDVIRDGSTGMLVEPGDTSGFVDAVSGLLSSDQMDQMSAMAVADAQTYSWGRVATETAEFYRNMLDLKSERKS